MTEELRGIFNQDAELYHRARPGYPAQLFTDLDDLRHDEPGRNRRFLEIGPGTGQATADLARNAHDLTAVELGPDLAAVLSRQGLRTGAGISIRVEVGSFEDWPLPVEPFDLVACFTAWHWLEPELRTARTATALRPGGSLATVTTTHVLGGTVDFFAQAQAGYERWDPATPPGLTLQPADAIAPDLDEADRSPDFAPAVRRRYLQDVTYSRAEYLDVLGTYSGHRALPAADREGLLSELGTLIDERYAGSVTKTYLYELRVARRR